MVTAPDFLRGPLFVKRIFGKTDIVSTSWIPEKAGMTGGVGIKEGLASWL